MNKIYIFLTLIIALFLPLQAEEWRLHPSFDNNPVRIIDTENDTYFLVHQQIYNKSLADYTSPSMTLFRYDKRNAENGIHPLVNSVALSGTGIALADYSHEGRYLLVGYENGGIDIVGDDGRVRYIDALCSSPVPGVNSLVSVCFEPSTADAWIATGAGYLHISAADKRVEQSALLGLPVDYVCRVGDKLILLSGGVIYEAPVGAASRSQLTPVSALAGFTACALMPIDTNRFAFLSGSPGQQNSVMLATRSGETWTTKTLGADTFSYLTSNFVTANPFECNIIPDKDGYLLYSSSKAWQLAKGENPRLTSITREDGGVAGSYDFTDFWEYRMRGNFVRRHAEYSLADGESEAKAAWSDIADPIRPNAPASYICTYMANSPAYGTIVSQHASDWNFVTYGQVNPQLTSVLSGDKWRVVSQAYHIPYAVEQDEALRAKYNSNRNAFPISDPRGAVIDPLFPDYIWQGSLWSGLGMMSLKDDRENMRRFAAPNNAFADYPSFQEIIENQGWGTMSCFSPVSADVDGNLWSLHFNYKKSVAQRKSFDLAYFSTERRQKMMLAPASENYTGETWKLLEIPYEISANMHGQILALKHPRNRNRLVIFPSIYSAPLFIYDHKGTLDDSSDDEFIAIPNFHNPAYGTSTIIQLNDMEEDPVTGKVIVGMSGWGWEFDPSAAENGKTMEVDLLRLKTDDGTEGELIMPLSCGLNKILVDDSGRLWLATGGDGVIGVSADRRRVIARYRPDDSPLPSGMTYGLMWNPQTRSLMISTDKGLAEVFPESEATSRTAGMPVLYPEQIQPGYNGVLHLRNLPPKSIIEIKDKEGKILARLENGISTTLTYDLRDSIGNPLPTGLYTATIGTIATLSFSLLR